MDNEQKVCTYKGAVLTSECDSNKHMNVMYYINKFEHAGRNFSHEIGIGHSYLRQHNLGVAVVEQLIQYKREVFEDDIVHIYSHAVGAAEKVMSFCHEMYSMQTNEVSAIMNIKLVMFDFEKRKAVIIPDDIVNLINARKL